MPQPPHTVAAKMSVQMTGCRVKPSIERDLVLDYVVPNESKFVLVVTFNILILNLNGILFYEKGGIMEKGQHKQ